MTYCAISSIQVTLIFFVLHFNSPFYSQLLFNQMLFFPILLYPNTFTDSARIPLSVLVWFGFFNSKKSLVPFSSLFHFDILGGFSFFLSTAEIISLHPVIVRII